MADAIETGKSEWKVSEVRKDDRCEFGDWLNELPAIEKQTDRYATLHSLHAEFHDAASHVLSLALSGRKEDAQAAIAHGSRFARISSKLTLTLSEWSKAISK